MCGIVGYVGFRNATPLILEGLRRLEYRGYDSAGLAVLQPDGTIGVRREAGKLVALAEKVQANPLSGSIGIGHTRWATHGPPCERNAHPHLGPRKQVAVVHNGIIENYRALREELEAEGHIFASDTDTEVVVHLVEAYLADGVDLEVAVRRALAHVKGANAFLFLSAAHPDRIVAVRLGNAGGLTVGLGEGENWVASDIPAILEHTRRMVFLEDRQMAVVRRDGVWVETLDGAPVPLRVHTIPWDPVAAAKEPYRHFMQKEIYEQARAITDTLRGRADFEKGRVRLEALTLTPQEARSLERLVIVACGTSAYAGLVGKFMIETLARLPVEVDYGSEFRYRDPLLNERTAVLAITQSGETVDTLAAMEEARRKGARLWSIVNVIGSQAHRLADGHILMHAGPEIGVASTKAFTTSLVDLYLLGCYLGELRGVLTGDALRQRVEDLALLPDLVGRVLQHGDEYAHLAQTFYNREHFLYLGRGINYPIALEGALKLKEISYIHAEGYPAGEMKHGPIALIDERMPVVAIAVRDHVYDKMVSQVEQVKARGGIVIALATEGDEEIAAKADYVLRVPAAPPLLSPVVNVIPLQLLAYHLAVRRGCDVDQPRNLAKSVTVE
ncbi:MAG: glutamine--fructose-6-phosphate transaminase (isomerizing) [Anaerolineae bacterium]|nr:glutamine--fructose-6-phosphate transaminase (isomerizing) [Anaerolineae bacterium]MCX8067269.1 glutamine--fructose-6-phosphate transaminase (isomerizing) [Anaerolineae bacterium]MDW7992649.1 glutamine--fructose-6-phosphate transaminase (isomerizing) [Anaerolineae bacterium]